MKDDYLTYKTLPQVCQIYPTVVRTIKRVFDTGEMHSVVVAKSLRGSGEVEVDTYVWGNPSDARLGGADIKQHCKPQPIKALKCALKRLNLKLASAPQQHDHAIVACGASHTVLLTESGRLLTWGCGKYGQLGYGDLWDREEPIVVPIVSSVSAFAAGSRHTIAVSEV